MSQPVNIAVSVFIFLIGLFLFKAIFPALGIVLVFLLLIALLEVVWQYRETSLVLVLINLVIAAVLTLTFYILVFLPIEFLITEVLLIVPEIFSFVNLAFLLILLIIFSLVSWERALKAKSFRWGMAVLVAISGLVFGVYRNHKLAREYLPKIYRISPSSGFQAQKIEIKGVNFFPIWKKGKVFIGDQEVTILDWNEKLIIAKQPVPNKFGQTELYLIRSDGFESNRMIFEINDPGKLKH